MPNETTEPDIYSQKIGAIWWTWHGEALLSKKQITVSYVLQVAEMMLANNATKTSSAWSLSADTWTWTPAEKLFPQLDWMDTELLITATPPEPDPSYKFP